ncbi:hypothetical protein GPJ56_003738 [Histomonas meleagridis]|uniref:uncharacterized protein n=1 Tax=Histomonas meleagridis TaxID=135588 RepID=UPI0035596087|nr:hypothetical protein GPJ56_003738 [Histomonas meleagridis]KAH0805196.1 hypothetical protein GO595_002141 [Histomonas meleagridis]
MSRRSSRNLSSISRKSSSSSVNELLRSSSIIELSDKISYDPIFYFQKYLNAFIQEPRELVVLRQSVSKSSSLTIKPTQIQYFPQDQTVRIKQEGGDRSYQINTFDKIEWGEVPGPSGNMKFINISIKGDRNPLILHGPSESMEFWYDALQVLHNKNAQPSTPSSLSRMEIFTKATEISKIPPSSNYTIPPPPPNLKFTCEFPPE